MELAELNRFQRAAVFMLSVSDEERAKLFRRLEPSEREKIVMAIAEVEMVDSGLKQEVLKTFYNEVLAVRGGVSGGQEKIKSLLEKTLGHSEASDILGRLNLRNTGEAEISNVLKTVDMEQLSRFLHSEQPQTIALILSLLDPGQAAQILQDLEEMQQSEVIMRMATMAPTDPEIVAQIGSVVKRSLSSSIGQQMKDAGGAKTVAEILNFVDRNTEKSIIGTMEERNAELAEEVKKMMFVFDDIINVEDRSMQRILKEVDTSELAMALKSASDAVKEKVFGNISKRAAELIKEEIEYMGPVRLKDVEEAQQRIVNIVRRLEEEGEVVIAGRGGVGEEFV